MKFNLPRRQRKSFESITKKMVSDNFNKTESTELFSNVRKQYTDAPRTFGANEGKKEATLELLIIIGNQIAEEYKDLQIEVWFLVVPELSKKVKLDN